jgi:hypothetical protein
MSGEVLKVRILMKNEPKEADARIGLTTESLARANENIVDLELTPTK